VHFHHLAKQPPNLVNIAKDNGVATIFTIHDFYSICHISNLINFEGKYCQPDTLVPADCDICLNKKYGIEPGSQAIRRAYWNNLFSDIDGLIFNTQGGFDLAAKIYPNVANHLNVEILPVAIESIEIPKVEKRDSDELRVAILGNFVHHKGADVTLEVIQNLTGENISFHFFGEIEDIYEAKIKLSKNPNIYRYGKYPSGKLPIELFSCDVSLHASICPETYGLVLSESWAAGLVPIVSDIGALGERVINGVNGLKVKVGSSYDLSKTLLKILGNKRSLDLLKLPTLSLPLSTYPYHAEKILDFYITTLKSLRSEKLVNFSKTISNSKIAPHQWVKIREYPQTRKMRWNFFKKLRLLIATLIS
jgi:glycosyltransferase involved in cell wall biosynthesis